MNPAWDLLISGGNVILPDAVHRLDIGVRQGKIAALSAELTGRAQQTIDATGRLIFPGLIDPHTHMGIPIKHTTSADDFNSGSVAAAFGGTTTIIDFTVHGSGRPLRESLDQRLALADGNCYVDYSTHVNLTHLQDQQSYLAQIPPLIIAGFPSFKAFTTYREAQMMMPAEAMRPVLQTIHDHGGLLLVHAEDNDMVERETAAHIAAGHRDPLYHARSRPAEAEAVAVERVSAIAAEVGATVYFVHLSSRAGLEAACRARNNGASIYLETCPHYLLLDESAYQRENGHRYIATPPLRTTPDREALWAAVESGEIDTIGTDHCPFTCAQKDAYAHAFQDVPNGLPAVETRFALLYTYGAMAGRLRLPHLSRLLATNAARIFNLPDKGEIRPGADADLMIWDPEPETVISAANQHDRADWTPYEGVPVSGRLTHTILRGRMLVENGEWVENVPAGQLILRGWAN